MNKKLKYYDLALRLVGIKVPENVLGLLVDIITVTNKKKGKLNIEDIADIETKHKHYESKRSKNNYGTAAMARRYTPNWKFGFKPRV
jgi:hypothetical protein